MRGAGLGACLVRAGGGGWPWPGHAKAPPWCSMAPCSCALSCAHDKTGVGRPAQPARGMPRAHGANGPVQGHPPPLDNFPRARPKARAVQCHLKNENAGQSPAIRTPSGGEPPFC
ncbi:D-alanine--D-alanine ligase [Stenotrophomonas maltophilia EPM1]|nr:D-alanine--D-alanine ligase [Stenotrophomonas maltophilia EPM1]